MNETDNIRAMILRSMEEKIKQLIPAIYPDDPDKFPTEVRETEDGPELVIRCTLYEE
jgi:hypothetical protein